jgi:hypothetical protein
MEDREGQARLSIWTHFYPKFGLKIERNGSKSGRPFEWAAAQRSISLLSLNVALLFHMQAYDIHFDTWEHMLLPPEKTF